MKKIILITMVVLSAISVASGQGAAINLTGAQAKESAILDVSSDSMSNIQGILIPRVRLNSETDTANFVHPVSEAKGLLVFNTGYGGLSPEGFYYWNGTKWVHTGASATGGSTHYIGEAFGGGTVFYVDKTGQHGLIVSNADISTGSVWSNVSTTLIGVTAQSNWDGDGNTDAIINQPLHNTSAAQLCRNYNGGGNNDWYLPAEDELYKIFDARYELSKALGTNSVKMVTRYWSSTEKRNDMAFYFVFYGGGGMSTGDTYDSKSSSYYVRAVRAF